MYYLALFRQRMCLFYLNVEPYATKALFICNKTSNVSICVQSDKNAAELYTALRFSFTS